MTWGHAVSRDMIHWRELADALHPDALGTIYSGSAVVDRDNTSGFKRGEHDPLVCFYTSAANNPWARQAGSKFAQSIAYSQDSGQTWTKYRDNPVISHIIGGNRDPKVLWHEPTGRWVMALFLAQREMAFFSSSDLKQWTEESRWTDCQYECPEFFEMAVDGDPVRKKWVFYGGSGEYYVGGFDGKRFTPESELIKFHHGNCFYASQTFNNMPDGRRVQIAWGRVATRGMPFNQCMLFPVELTLHATEQGERLRVNPIPEIDSLHRQTHSSEAFTLEAGQKRVLNGAGDLFHIKAEFAVATPGSFGLRIRGRDILYDARQQQLTCLNKTAALKPIDRRIRLEILVDGTTLEIFANAGRVYMPMGTIPKEDDRSLEVFCRDGSVRVESIVVHELNSIWW